MADTKISALPASTTPLAGTETLPVVQSSATKQVSVSNLTVGRAVNVGSLGVGVAPVTAVQVGVSGTATGTQETVLLAKYSSDTDQFRWLWNYSGSGYLGIGTSGTSMIFGRTTGTTGAVGATLMTIATGGDITVNTGNLIPGTAAKGINFSANTPAAGKTSTLLNWYEEGTWTPTQGSGLTVVGAFSSAGYYTRVGNVITVTGTVTGATSVALAGNAQLCGGLPYIEKSGSVALGLAMNSNTNSSAGIYVSTTTLNSVSALSAAGTIYFSATYLV